LSNAQIATLGPNGCVHGEFYTLGTRCGRPPFTRRTHGWLCHGHYRDQQETIPPKPRQPQERWKGWQAARPLTDDQIIAEILATDRALIAAGKVVTITRGRTDPVQLRLLESPTCH
jgi:hypothetical protein